MIQNLHHIGYGALPVLLAIGIAGCSGDKQTTTAEAPKAAVRHPEQKTLRDYLELNGWLEPLATQELRSRVQGQISQVNFKDGQQVKKGDVLFEIDPRTFETALDAAKAQVAAADANMELAHKEYARTDFLVRSKAAPQQDLDVWTAKLLVAKAERQKALAGVEQAELNLDYSRIKSEIDGRVGRAALSEGNMVNVGGGNQLLATIVDKDTVKVVFNIDERSRNRYADVVLKKGQNVADVLADLPKRKVEFSFAMGQERDFKNPAELIFIDNRIDPDTGTIEGYGTLKNESGKFEAGARVRVRLPFGDPEPRLFVKETAILSDQDKRYVLIADDDNVVQRRNVKLGMSDGEMVAIQPSDALPEGEKPEDWWVIIDNLQRVRLHQPVDPQKPSP